MSRAARLAVALTLLALPVSASAGTVRFAGSCQFSGPIAPTPPITAVPQPGAHFSYLGTGSCAGTVAGPITVAFTNVSTVFDTCELGPDLNLTGIALIGSGPQRGRFVVTIDLARLALAGPFLLRTTGGGQAQGVAQFQPQDAAGAPQQCASGGVASASLSASFQTVSPLVGTADPIAGGGGPGGAGGRWHTKPYKRHKHHRVKPHGSAGCRQGTECSRRER